MNVDDEPSGWEYRRWPRIKDGRLVSVICIEKMRRVHVMISKENWTLTIIISELRRLTVVVQGLVPTQFDQLAHTREKMMSLIDRNAVIIEAKMDRSSTGEQTPSPSTESISSFDSDIENPSDDEAYEGL